MSFTKYPNRFIYSIVQSNISNIYSDFIASKEIIQLQNFPQQKQSHIMTLIRDFSNLCDQVEELKKDKYEKSKAQKRNAEIGRMEKDITKIVTDYNNEIDIINSPQKFYFSEYSRKCYKLKKLREKFLSIYFCEYSRHLSTLYFSEYASGFKYQKPQFETHEKLSKIPLERLSRYLEFDLEIIKCGVYVERTQALKNANTIHDEPDSSFYRSKLGKIAQSKLDASLSKSEYESFLRNFIENRRKLNQAKYSITNSSFNNRHRF